MSTTLPRYGPRVYTFRVQDCTRQGKTLPLRARARPIPRTARPTSASPPPVHLRRLPPALPGRAFLLRLDRAFQLFQLLRKRLDRRLAPRQLLDLALLRPDPGRLVLGR